MKEFESFFKTVEGGEGKKCNYPTRLDTYGCGCQHDCKYCYAKSLLNFRELWNAVEPAVANIDKITVTCTDDAFCAKYEKATPPSKRIAAIEKLQAAGFDVQLRLSPFIPQFAETKLLNLDIINSVKCDKILVEFLRVNTWIRKWFKINYSDYTFNQGGYKHIPLKWKRHYLKMITGYKELSVCEDVLQHYKYWKENVNHNPEDCCNLRKKI